MHAKILKGQRGPKGGYSLARERRRISMGDIVRSAFTDLSADPDHKTPPLLHNLIFPALAEASAGFLNRLDALSLADLCETYEKLGPQYRDLEPANFTI